MAQQQPGLPLPSSFLFYIMAGQPPPMVFKKKLLWPHFFFLSARGLSHTMASTKETKLQESEKAVKRRYTNVSTT